MISKSAFTNTVFLSLLVSVGSASAQGLKIGSQREVSRANAIVSESKKLKTKKSDAKQDGKIDQLATKYQVMKTKVKKDDEFKRNILSSLYLINRKMKSMSEKRTKLSNKMFSVRGNIKDLAQQIISLEANLATQRLRLSRRLKVIYMLGEQAVLRVLFSSQSASSLDRNLKYLKSVSEQDFDIIANYRKSLAALEQKKLKMKSEIIRLVNVKKGLKGQELDLETEQNSKAKVLASLRRRRVRYLKSIKNIRSKAKSVGLSDDDQSLMDLINGAFFEKKGSLFAPVNGVVTQTYGLRQDPEFRYRLSHKGLFYNAPTGEDVHSIFSGRVAFTGDVPGYGKTVVVDHGDHYYSVYSFASEIVVSQGQRVGEQQTISKVGHSTTEGPGLYFEIRHFSGAIDPAAWIGKQKIKSETL